MPRLRSSVWLVSLTLPWMAAAQPLDLGHTASRAIQVEFETSPSLEVVGVTYGPPVAAQYSVVGTTGTVSIASADYEAVLGGPGFSISDVVFDIDLLTGEASIGSVSGSFTSMFGAYTFTWSLSTTQSAGIIDVLAPIHCASQAEIDNSCPSVPVLCGATCLLVPGLAYDPATGKLNMVGFETQDGCAESGCGVFNIFLQRGDLRLSERPSVTLPGLGAVSLSAVALLLMGVGVWRIVGRAVADPFPRNSC